MVAPDGAPVAPPVSPPVSCTVRTAAALQDAVTASSGSATSPTPIVLCGDVALTAQINMSGKSFALSCTAGSVSCTISGSSTSPTRLFSGSPVFADFRSINFANGISGRGGAFLLDGGGRVSFTNCKLSGNFGSFGAAIYAQGSVNLVVNATEFSKNAAVSFAQNFVALGNGWGWSLRRVVVQHSCHSLLNTMYFATSSL